MKNFLVSIICLVVVGFCGTNLSFACGCGCGDKCSCGCPKQCECPPPSACDKPPVTKEDFAKFAAKGQERLNAELGLTKVQQEQAKAIFDAKFKAMGPVFSEIRAKKQALSELEKTSFNPLKARERKEQKSELKTQLAALKERRRELSAKFDADFEAVLSDAQKTKWAQMKAERKEKHHHHRPHCDSCGCQI